MMLRLTILLWICTAASAQTNPCKDTNKCSTVILFDNINASTPLEISSFVMNTNGSTTVVPNLGDWTVVHNVSRHIGSLSTTAGTFMYAPRDVNSITNHSAHPSDDHVVTCAMFAGDAGSRSMYSPSTGYQNYSPEKASCPSSSCITDLQLSLQQRASKFLSAGPYNISTVCADLFANVSGPDSFQSCAASKNGSTGWGMKTVSYPFGNDAIPLAQFIYDLPGQPEWNGDDDEISNMSYAAPLNHPGNYTAYDRAIESMYSWLIFRYVDDQTKSYDNQPVDGINHTASLLANPVFDISVFPCLQANILDGSRDPYKASSSAASHFSMSNSFVASLALVSFFMFVF